MCSQEIRERVIFTFVLSDFSHVQYTQSTYFPIDLLRNRFLYSTLSNPHLDLILSLHNSSVNAQQDFVCVFSISCSRNIYW